MKHWLNEIINDESSNTGAKSIVNKQLLSVQRYEPIYHMRKANVKKSEEIVSVDRTGLTRSMEQLDYINELIVGTTLILQDDSYKISKSNWKL